MTDFGEWNKKVKTRKQHDCISCDRAIPKGMTAYSNNGMIDGEWCRYYLCAFCQEHVPIGEGEPIDNAFYEWISDREPCDDCGEWRNVRRKWLSDGKTMNMHCMECGTEWEIYIGYGGNEKKERVE